jgi:hypothetical protein
MKYGRDAVDQDARAEAAYQRHDALGPSVPGGVPGPDLVHRGLATTKAALTARVRAVCLTTVRHEAATTRPHARVLEQAVELRYATEDTSSG